MKVLYVSTCCSNKAIDFLFKTAIEKPGLAIQKFHFLLIKGLILNDVFVQCLSCLPVTKRTHKKLFWNIKKEHDSTGAWHIKYIPFINQPALKFLIYFVYSFFYTMYWSIKHRKDGVILCDVLNLPISFGAVIAGRLLGMKIGGIVTDIPGYMSFSKTHKKSYIKQLLDQLNLYMISLFTHYIPLTDSMCDIINKRKKPYVVIEGLVDIKMRSINPDPYRDGKKHITYCGSLYEKYGVKTFIDAFLKVENSTVVLDIYGPGEMEKDMPIYEQKDDRIKYHGVVTNIEAVKAQLSSYLLVNPRPTTEAFTQYSFPSKNVEYMVSGVPLLTTKLSGMPKEYYPNVFLFEEETVEAYAETIRCILSQPIEKVHEMGNKGKSFVLKYKNNKIQAGKIIKLLEEK
ncbi:MAG: glycosyltransferase [Bacteroidaceae bacterium]